ncbi:UNVERIFIED_CONTAM: hypothetical protein HDU68_007604 [Siphonaria sp. JEL0065]|nr:hypothetical protein HDU68_007604 [Siphonaria sp. JEL0065]
MLLQVVLATLAASLASAQACTSGVWGCNGNNLSVCQDAVWAIVTACAATKGCRAAPYYDCGGPASGGSTTTTTTTKKGVTSTKTVSTTTTTTTKPATKTASSTTSTTTTTSQTSVVPKTSTSATTTTVPQTSVASTAISSTTTTTTTANTTSTSTTTTTALQTSAVATSSAITGSTTTTTTPLPPTIDLSLWFIQLPDGTAGSLFPASTILAQGSPRFFSQGSNLVFITPTNGTPTSGSTHPRTELRQMAVGGGNANWKVDDGQVHKLSITTRVDAFPTGSAESIIVAQMFGSGGPEVMVRVYQTGIVKLFNNYQSAPSVQLESGYKIGQYFSVILSVNASGSVLVSYVNLGSGVSSQVTTLVDTTQSYFFKTGSYCQCLATDSGTCQVTMSSLLLDGQNV